MQCQITVTKRSEDGYPSTAFFTEENLFFAVDEGTLVIAKEIGSESSDILAAFAPGCWTQVKKELT